MKAASTMVAATTVVPSNSAMAVEMARAALAVIGEDDPGTLDTLAAALAETGAANETNIQPHVASSSPKENRPEKALRRCLAVAALMIAHSP